MSTAAAVPSVEVMNAPAVEVVGAPAPPSSPVVLTDAAIAKVKEIMATQDPVPAGLRIGVSAADARAFSIP